MGESARWTGPRRLGPSFRMLMQIRALLTVLTFFLIPFDSLDAAGALVILGLTLLYWLVAHYWERLLPRLMAHPILTGVDLFISLLVLSFEGPSVPFFQSTVAASVVAGLVFRWRGMVLVSVVQVVCYFAALGYHSTLLGESSIVGGFQTLFTQPAYYPVFGVVGVMLRRIFDEQESIEQARRDADIRTVAADERARLAREMHDSLAKTLRGIAMSAQALPVWVRKSPERATDEAQRIASAAEVASREARELITELRDDQVQQPLVTSVRNVLDRWEQRTGTTVDSSLDETADLSLIARYELISILKEALANIDQHAGASRVEVRLSDESPELTLVIRDDGTGFATPPEGPGWLDALAREGHYGVVGMHERAKRANAVLSVRSAPGEGTTLTVVFTGEAEHPPDMSSGSDERQHAEAG